MPRQITIHGKRTETVYAFTVHYKGNTITGRHFRISGVDEDEPLGLPEEDEKWEFDPPAEVTFNYPPKEDKATPSEKLEVVCDSIKQAIEDYEKIHN